MLLFKHVLLVQPTYLQKSNETDIYEKMLARSRYARPVDVGRSGSYPASNIKPSNLNFTRARVPKSAITRVRVPVHQSYIAYAPVTPASAAAGSS